MFILGKSKFIKMKKWFDTLRKERKIRKDKRKEENVWNQFPDSGKILPVPPPTPNASHSQLQNVPPPSPQFDVKKIKKKKSGISSISNFLLFVEKY